MNVVLRGAQEGTKSGTGCAKKTNIVGKLFVYTGGGRRKRFKQVN